jgi:quinol monooxygenase YgiN
VPDLVAIVELEATGGTRDEVAARLLKHAELSRREDGCKHFDVVVARDDAKKIYLYEVWRDQAALDAHAVSPHRKQIAVDLKDKYRQVRVIWASR